MNSNSSKDLKLILHPYTFILKEGKTINQNLLDYHLMMLHVSCPETIKSPRHFRPAEFQGKMMNLIKNPLPQSKEKGCEIS